MDGALSRVPSKVDAQVMRRVNRAIVLNLVRDDPELTRAAVVRRTGLSPAAVSGIVDGLIREGLVREESTEATGRVGRRPLRLALNPTARLAVGVCIGVHEISAALVDLGGTAGAVIQAPLPAGVSAETAMDLAANLARRVMGEIPPARLLGVGVGVPGMVSWPDGVNLFSPNLGWHHAPVRAMLEERLGRDVLVDNEVRALAIAEQQYGAARGARTAVFLDAGYGVGGAVILDGSLYRGRRGAAGEFGHNTVDPRGPLCGCGNRGCLEVFASTSGLVARAQEALAAGQPSALRPDGLTFDAMVAAASTGDMLARGLLDDAAVQLGLAVANAVDNWDPELVVLSGSVIRSGGLFETLLAIEQRSVLETGRTGVRIVPALLGADVKIVGAATLVIANYLATPHHANPAFAARA